MGSLDVAWRANVGFGPAQVTTVEVGTMVVEVWKVVSVKISSVVSVADTLCVKVSRVFVVVDAVWSISVVAVTSMIEEDVT